MGFKVLLSFLGFPDSEAARRDSQKGSTRFVMQIMPHKSAPSAIDTIQKFGMHDSRFDPGCRCNKLEQGILHMSASLLITLSCRNVHLTCTKGTLIRRTHAMCSTTRPFACRQASEQKLKTIFSCHVRQVCGSSVPLGCTRERDTTHSGKPLHNEGSVQYSQCRSTCFIRDGAGGVRGTRRF